MDKIGLLLQTALGAMQASSRGIQRTAQAVATGSARPGEAADLAAPLVYALEQQRALEAAAQVLHHAGRALDSILAAMHR